VQKQRQVLTIATGKKLYLDMAATLARSFFLWHANSSIKFQLVTDLVADIPADISNRIEIIPVRKGEIGEGFSPKLHLDKLARSGQTLFIDSDCLIYRNLDTVFRQFEGHSFSVVGNYIKEGEWFGNIAAICEHFKVPELPKFNGGVYYLEKGAMVGKLYEKAREIEQYYDEAGFIRLRNRPNDEVVLSTAMALFGQTPIPDDGSIMAEFVNFQSGIKSALSDGVAELYNMPGHKYYQAHWPLQSARPAIVHFLGQHNRTMPYMKEARLLKYLAVNRFPMPLARVAVFFQISLPYQILSAFKNSFRPAYHMLFGPRRIKKSERIID
jgi:hypothetical protein